MLNGVWVLGFTSIIGSLTHLKIDMGLLGTQLLTPVTGLFCESPTSQASRAPLKWSRVFMQRASPRASDGRWVCLKLRSGCLTFVGHQGELHTVDTVSLPALVSSQRQGYDARVGSCRIEAHSHMGRVLKARNCLELVLVTAWITFHSSPQ